MESQTYFTVKDPLGKRIRTTRQYWQKIVQIKHPIMQGRESEVKKTLRQPELVKLSKHDASVVLYYRKRNRHNVCVVTRHEDGTGFIITAYITSRISEGEIVWEA